MSKKPNGALGPDDVAREQMSVNFHWLLDRVDGIHHALCHSMSGTWQERAIQAETQAYKLMEAVKPFVHFINQFDRKPLLKLDDQFYGIHNGTEFEANLKFSELRKLRDACQQLYPVEMAIRINGKAVVLTGEDRYVLSYKRIVELADTKWSKEALHGITFRHNDGRSGMVGPGASVSPSPAMYISAAVCGDA